MLRDGNVLVQREVHSRVTGPFDDVASRCSVAAVVPHELREIRQRERCRIHPSFGRPPILDCRTSEIRPLSRPSSGDVVMVTAQGGRQETAATQLHDRVDLPIVQNRVESPGRPRNARKPPDHVRAEDVGAVEVRHTDRSALVQRVLRGGASPLRIQVDGLGPRVIHAVAEALAETLLQLGCEAVVARDGIGLVLAKRPEVPRVRPTRLDRVLVGCRSGQGVVAVNKRTQPSAL